MSLYTRFSNLTWALIVAGSAVAATVGSDWRFGLGVALIVAAIRDAWTKR